MNVSMVSKEKETLQKEHELTILKLQSELEKMKLNHDKNDNNVDKKLKEMEIVEAKLEEANRVVANLTEAKDRETCGLQNQLEIALQEVDSLKGELVVVQQGTKGLERTLDFYKSNTEQWKQKFTSLESQLSSPSSLASSRAGIEDESSITVGSQEELVELQGTVEKQSKELVKLKSKVKKYAEKMAGMEVLVAEAAVIVKEHHFATKEMPSSTRNKSK